MNFLYKFHYLIINLDLIHSQTLPNIRRSLKYYFFHFNHLPLPFKDNLVMKCKYLIFNLEFYYLNSNWIHQSFVMEFRMMNFLFFILLFMMNFLVSILLFYSQSYQVRLNFQLDLQFFKKYNQSMGSRDGFRKNQFYLGFIWLRCFT